MDYLDVTGVRERFDSRHANIIVEVRLDSLFLPDECFVRHCAGFLLMVVVRDNRWHRRIDPGVDLR